MNQIGKNVSSTYTLYNGVQIPCIGFGTWKMPDEVVEDAVYHAINCGYRHIDTAAAYFNETGVGRGLKKVNVPREEVFVTSKLPNADHGYKKTLVSFEESLIRLQIEYLDLYLIHWPVIEEHKDHYEEDILDTWRAFEQLYEEGKIRAIGVSNFMESHLEILLQHGRLKPMVNQIQFNPQCVEEELRSYCTQNKIQIEGWSPLIQGHAFDHQILKDMAEKYQKTIAQICIRFALQNGVIPIPKSSQRERIANNADIFEFNIADEDMQQIATLKSFGRIGNPPDVPRKFQVIGF